MVVVREIAHNTTLTSELLRRTADLHAQAASIEQSQSFSLAEVERVTSSLPDQLSRLELKLDDLSKETSVFKSLSLDSGITIELTSKAVRHLLKGKGGRIAHRSSQKPEALALEGPSMISEGDPLLEVPFPESPSSPDVVFLFLVPWRVAQPKLLSVVLQVRQRTRR